MNQLTVIYNNLIIDLLEDFQYTLTRRSNLEEFSIDYALKFIASRNKLFFYGSTSLLLYEKKSTTIYKIVTDMNLAELARIIPNLKFDSSINSNCMYINRESIYLFLIKEISEENEIKYLKRVKEDNDLFYLAYSPKKDCYYNLGNRSNFNNIANVDELHIEDILDIAYYLSSFEEIVNLDYLDTACISEPFSLFLLPLVERILTSLNPYNGLNFLDKIAILDNIFPFIKKIRGVTQDRYLHPEGDVYEHTLHSFQYLKNPSLLLSYGLLLHDIGKAECVKSKGFGEHSTIGANMVRKILKPLGYNDNFIKDVEFLVRYHMVNSYFYRVNDKELKLIFDSGRGLELMRLFKADTLGSVGKLDVYTDMISKLKKYKYIERF